MTTGYVSTLGASPETPTYRKIADTRHPTTMYLIVCDEGWRESIVCTGMYERVADWFITQVQGKPYVAGDRL